VVAGRRRRRRGRRRSAHPLIHNNHLPKNVIL
jgi:hypothetical protein